MIKIQKNIPLAPYTTFKIGGPARYFAEVSDEEALIEALQYAKDNNLEIFILGGGSNILVSDKGFDGLVVKFKVQSPKFKVAVQNSKLLIECWAGESLANLVSFCTENNLSGLEWAAGIPGTVGGAVRGNAGAFGSSMADCVEEVKIIRLVDEAKSHPLRLSEASSLKLKTFENSNCEFGYRNSTFKQNPNLIIVSCILKLQKGNQSEIETRISDNLAKRSESQPKWPSAGSFFENPKVSNKELIKLFEKDVEQKSKNGKIPAGWLIDRAGLRGKKIGGAQMSEKHANFVMNAGQATAQDVTMLISLVKQQVRDKFGVELKEEVQYVGF